MTSPAIRTPHALVRPASAMESSRELFCRALIMHLDRDMRPKLRTVYERDVRPRLLAELGREPDRTEVARAMRRLGANEWYSGLRMIAQRASYTATIAVVSRQLDDLIDIARTEPLGELSTDPALPVPPYVQALDTHHMPGSYHTERRAEDVFAAAVFDRQITVNRAGMLGPLNDDTGVSLAAWVKARFPELKPQRILELGCTVGHTLAPFKSAFPDAEVYGIDVSAPCLRYARARASSLGLALKLSQQNAEATEFADGSFDLVFSRILMHETSRDATRRIFAEARRLVRPGGLVFHSEGAPFDELDAYTGALRDWDIRWNNEPYMETYYALPLERLFEEAGFEPSATFRDYAPSVLVSAGGVAATNTLNGGRYFVAGAIGSASAETRLPDMRPAVAAA